jgi:hypothetical protein
MRELIPYLVWWGEGLESSGLQHITEEGGHAYKKEQHRKIDSQRTPHHHHARDIQMVGSISGDLTAYRNVHIICTDEQEYARPDTYPQRR